MVGGMEAAQQVPPAHKGGPCQSGKTSSGLKFNERFGGNQRNIDRYVKAWKDAGYSYCGITPHHNQPGRRHYMLYKNDLEKKVRTKQPGKQELMRDMSEHVHLFEDPNERDRVCAIPTMAWMATHGPSLADISDIIRPLVPGGEINLVEAPVGSTSCGDKQMKQVQKVLRNRRDQAATPERERYDELLELGDVGRQVSAYNRDARVGEFFGAITTPRSQVKDAQQKVNFRRYRDTVKSQADARDKLYQIRAEREQESAARRSAAEAAAEAAEPAAASDTSSDEPTLMDSILARAAAARVRRRQADTGTPAAAAAAAAAGPRPLLLDSPDPWLPDPVVDFPMASNDDQYLEYPGTWNRRLPVFQRMTEER